MIDVTVCTILHPIRVMGIIAPRCVDHYICIILIGRVRKGGGEAEGRGGRGRGEEGEWEGTYGEHLARSCLDSPPT